MTLIENYLVLLELGDVVLLPFTFIIDPSINLIRRIHDEYDSREHYITVLQEYLIITRLE